jgi:starch phosphorylase
MRPVSVPTAPTVSIPLPPRLAGLHALAYNLYWTWHPDVRALFSRVDPTLWARHRNPIPVLQGAGPWQPLLDDADFMATYETVLGEFERYMGADPRSSVAWRPRLEQPIAYFCAEYGLHESLGFYSGGLGILAGDHCKAASDLGLPFVAVGLLYRHGYFRQTIDADGHQEHAYPDFDPGQLPLLEVVGPDGGHLRVPVEVPGRTVWAAVWVAQVGRVPLLLLDTDISDNTPSDQPITNILYVRGREMRLHQELVLGIGGVRALRALDIHPAAWHLNEGHSAFLLVERAAELTRAGTELDDALRTVKRDSVFTIHTPVSAGNERFDAELVRRVAAPICETAGLPLERLLEIGRGTDEGSADQFDMTAFSLRLTNASNAVSRLHAETAQKAWAPLAERPIINISNGVHLPTWLGQPMRDLYERHLGMPVTDPLLVTNGERRWRSLRKLPAAQLWETHQHQKLELAYFARHRLREQFARLGEPPAALEELEAALDPEILTLGFARRFATYKRAYLLFYDEERLSKLIWDKERPLQVIIAGKAHPADRPGQRVIQEIFTRSRSPQLRGRVFIVEDYDMRVARFLVQGVDVWLNNPRRPLEASGTSGMKGAANGAVNCSVLDGWWDEGWDGTNGWAIGDRSSDTNEAHQDYLDAQDLYRILEEEIRPRYYERDRRTGLPMGWIELMKNSITSTIHRYSAAHMVREYVDKLYLPAAGLSESPAPTLEEPAGADESLADAMLEPAAVEAGTRS